MTPPTLRYVLLALVLVGLGAAVTLSGLDPDFYNLVKAFLPLP